MVCLAKWGGQHRTWTYVLNQTSLRSALNGTLSENSPTNSVDSRQQSYQQVVARERKKLEPVASKETAGCSCTKDIRKADQSTATERTANACHRSRKWKATESATVSSQGKEKYIQEEGRNGPKGLKVSRIVINPERERTGVKIPYPKSF